MAIEQFLTCIYTGNSDQRLSSHTILNLSKLADAYDIKGFNKKRFIQFLVVRFFSKSIECKYEGILKIIKAV